MPGIGIRGEVPLAAQRREVGHTEGNDVVIGSQKPPAGQFPHPVGGLTAQQCRHLLGDHRAAEHPRDRIAHALLEQAFDALRQTLLGSHRTAYLERGVPRGAALVAVMVSAEVSGSSLKER